MYELIQLGRNTYYIECTSRIGIYKLDEKNICVIDTGDDIAASEALLKYMRQNNWTLKMVLNTHSHADHIAGNAILTERTGCKCYCAGIETVFIEHPFLEPSFIYGADPFDAIETKVYIAQPTHAYELTPEVIPQGFEALRLDGHTFAMTAFKTPDDVWFLGDAVVSSGVLKKYHLTFLVDVAKYLDSLDIVEKLSGKLFVPAHAKPKEDIRPLVQENRDNTLEIIDLIYDLCKFPHSQEELQRDIFRRYERHMSVPQYVLTGSIIRTYLSYMRDVGKIEYLIEDNMVIWKSVR
ncbi:MAG: MBL fold metallo-hydrolase [Oscillospiraceae bacterium]|nr:MBL fold metallo-hydrolase [Oscillospiraceae bacterium]